MFGHAPDTNRKVMQPGQTTERLIVRVAEGSKA